MVCLGKGPIRGRVSVADGAQGHGSERWLGVQLGTAPDAAQLIAFGDDGWFDRDALVPLAVNDGASVVGNGLVHIDADAPSGLRLLGEVLLVWVLVELCNGLSFVVGLSMPVSSDGFISTPPVYLRIHLV